ncbi:phenylacetate--CoA ligase family protein [Dyella sp. ASV21]|uniref:phenylacetate--CoA ligase family protein n=1 Tax=Dyella sp. ASV21 TaxID=2795114 RepID=UPI0018ED9F5D|nr:phenylacetate--CoA ligase family protein [Dyella sp. ASV21]
MSGWYETAFQHVLYPAYETGLRRRSTLSWLSEYRSSQWLPPEGVVALQWARLKRLLAHCEREVPFYRRRWRELGITAEDIQCPDDFAKLPLLSKDDIRNHFDELQAESWRDRLLFKATGGSTGEPLRFGYTRESNDRRTAVMWRGYEWAGSRMGRRTMYLWAGAIGESGRMRRLKDRLYNAAFARRTLNSFQMTEANMAEYADAIDRYRPEIIVAYVGPLVRLAQWLVDVGRSIHQPRAIVGAAEALHEFQRELLEKAFGCPAFNTYGCREVMLIAAECEQRCGLHVNADHLAVELVDRNGAVPRGRPGDVVVTDLFNYGMPLIRYVNGDMATEGDGACSCGRGLPLLSRVDGRVLDAIISPDGHLLPGIFFPHMLKEVRGIERFQVVQRRLDQLDISIVRGKDFEEEALPFIRHEVHRVLGASVALNFQFVDDIALTRSGKLRVTVSELHHREGLAGPA